MTVWWSCSFYVSIFISTGAVEWLTSQLLPFIYTMHLQRGNGTIAALHVIFEIYCYFIDIYKRT